MWASLCRPSPAALGARFLSRPYPLPRPCTGAWAWGLCCTESSLGVLFGAARRGRHLAGSFPTSTSSSSSSSSSTLQLLGARPTRAMASAPAAAPAADAAAGGGAKVAPVVLIVCKVLDRIVERLQGAAVTVHMLPDGGAERAAFLQEEGPKVTAAVTTSFDGFDNSLFASLPSLKLISNFGVGVDGIDVKKAHSLNVDVSNTPDVLTDDVADIALGLMLCFARRLCVSDRFVRAHKWPGQIHMPLTMKFSGKTVGILGLGRIGQAVAKRAAAFDCKIAYWSRRPKEGVEYSYYETPAALAAAVHFLVVACALTPDTKGIVSAQVLEALGTKGVLINIGRGAHVDEPALVKALVEGRIKGAGLDVYADEPNVPEELMALENVVLLPHIGSNSLETRTEMADLVVDNILRLFQGQPLITPVERH